MFKATTADSTMRSLGTHHTDHFTPNLLSLSTLAMHSALFLPFPSIYAGSSTWCHQSTQASRSGMWSMRGERPFTTWCSSCTTA